MNQKQRILIAPLDWGLGHATRCIPLIRKWISDGHEVVLAVSGNTEQLLRGQFPGLRFIPLQGYNVHYSKGSGLIYSLLWQLPKILRAIRAENKWLSQLLEHEHFDLVVSDNRYGLHSKKAKCVLITHQVWIKVPYPWRLANGVIHKKIHQFINRFDECWIPDRQGESSLAGELSHGKNSPGNVKYIGWLSRFRTAAPAKQPSDKHVVLISGPEPQRSIFEAKMLYRARREGRPTLIIRGQPGDTSPEINEGPIRIVNHLQDEEMLHALLHAERITCRPGYSTLMDLRLIGKKATLVPTPGQTEQEYLAGRLGKRENWEVISQDELT